MAWLLLIASVFSFTARAEVVLWRDPADAHLSGWSQPVWRHLYLKWKLVWWEIHTQLNLPLTHRLALDRWPRRHCRQHSLKVESFHRFLLLAVRFGLKTRGTQRALKTVSIVSHSVSLLFSIVSHSVCHFCSQLCHIPQNFALNFFQASMK